MRTSAVVVTYRRLARLGEVLDGWLSQVGSVWLVDCSEGGFDVGARPVMVARFRPDPGSRARHAVAAMAPGELVFKGDDDIVPLPGLVRAFEEAVEAKGPGIYGVHGRRFYGPRYYGDTRMFGKSTTRELTPVDFVGVLTASTRGYLPMDLEGCASAVEDLWWQMRCHPRAPKWVVPSRGLVRDLPESGDQGRLCASRGAKAVREIFYREWYERNYAPGRRP